MDWNLILACAHHLAVFSLVGIFAAEFALIRPGLGGARLGQLARIDAAYGAVATVVIAGLGLIGLFIDSRVPTRPPKSIRRDAPGTGEG